jgi:hypothetical protein
MNTNNATNEFRARPEVIRDALLYLEDHDIHLMLEWVFDGD